MKIIEPSKITSKLPEEAVPIACIKQNEFFQSQGRVELFEASTDYYLNEDIMMRPTNLKRIGIFDIAEIRISAKDFLDIIMGANSFY